MFTNDELKNYLNDLKHITSIDSQSNDVNGISLVMDFFVNQAKDLSMQSYFIDNTPQSGPLLLISNGAKDEKLDVLMIAHLDTVYPKGTAKERGFKIEGNKVLAPGCIDDKGGALLGMYALKHLNLDDIKIGLLLNINEEVGSIGSRDIIKDLAQNASNVLVLEASREDGSLVNKRYGTINYEITISGVGGNVLDVNSNIVSPVADFANILRTLLMIKSFNHSLISNIYQIHTSENNAKNHSLSSMSIGFYVRYLDSYSLKSVQDKIELIKEKKLNQNVDIQVKKVSHYSAMEEKSTTRSLKRLIELEGKNLGIDIKWQTSFGGSDGCFASLGCDKVIDGMGPIGGKFHSNDEYLLIDSVAPRCNLLINVINKIIKEKTPRITIRKQNDKQQQ